MTAIWILCGIVLFFLLLGSIPLSVRFQFGTSLRLQVRICGLSILTIPPPRPATVDLRKFTYQRHQRLLRKEERKRKKREKTALLKKEKKESAAKMHKTPRLTDAHQHIAEGDNRLQEMIPVFFAVLDTIPKFFGKLECDIKKLYVTAGGEDAAEAAVHFGMLSQSVAYLLEILDTHTRLKILSPHSLRVCVDYCTPRNVYDVDFTLTTRPAAVLYTGVEWIAAWLRRRK